MIDFPVDKKIHLSGSIMISFKEITLFSISELFRITFNTAFIGENN